MYLVAKILALAVMAVAMLYAFRPLVRLYRDARSLAAMPQEQREADFHRMNLLAALALGSAIALVMIALSIESLIDGTIPGTVVAAMAVGVSALPAFIVYFTYTISLRAGIWQLDAKARGAVSTGYGTITCTECGNPSHRLADWMSGELLDADTVTWVCRHCGHTNMLGPRPKP